MRARACTCTEVFTGDAILPTHPCVKMDELRVLGCSGVPRFLEGLPRPQNIGSVIVPDNSVILRPVFFTFCVVHSRKLNRECVFAFGSKKNEASLAVLFFLFDSCEHGRRIWSRAGRADLAFGSQPLTHD